MVISYCI